MFNIFTRHSWHASFKLWCKNICLPNIPSVAEPALNLYKLKRNLTVSIDTPDAEVSQIFKDALCSVQTEYADRKYDYYKIYLKHLFGKEVDTAEMVSIRKRLKRIKEEIDYRITSSKYNEQYFVYSLLDRNKYVSKSTKRSGVIVKLFRSRYRDHDVMVKTYIYDPACQSIEDRMMSGFRDEATFQYYANQMILSFISPKLYSCGQLIEYPYIRNNYRFKCLYLIMEYIPGLTLAEAIYNTDTMKYMYDKVNEANQSMIAAGFHHNDLHNRNVMVTDSSPAPEIVILDFGEASFGPRKPLKNRL